VINQNISLKDYNTFGIEASAKHFARFSSIKQAAEHF
jgi:UDP-N-acetylenolpyruvoylglucosamine reductase